MKEKRAYKVLIVVLAVIAVVASISLWTYRSDLYSGFDAGFEQTK